jgi:hypothetical protein
MPPILIPETAPGDNPPLDPEEEEEEEEEEEVVVVVVVEVEEEGLLGVLTVADMADEVPLELGRCVVSSPSTIKYPWPALQQATASPPSHQLPSEQLVIATSLSASIKHESTQVRLRKSQCWTDLGRSRKA